MKQLLATLAVLISCGSANAEFVIDDFSHALTTLSNFLPGGQPSQSNFPVAGGTRTTTVSPGARIIFGNGSFRFTGLGINTQANMTYTLSSLLNLSGVGANSNPLLLLDLFGTVQGGFIIDVTLSSTTAAASYTFPSVNVLSAGKLDFNGTTVPLPIATTVDRISINFTQTSPILGIGNFFRSGPGAKISATPEPASLALLGITGFGGWCVARRRGRKTQTAD